MNVYEGKMLTYIVGCTSADTSALAYGYRGSSILPTTISIKRRPTSSKKNRSSKVMPDIALSCYPRYRPSTSCSSNEVPRCPSGGVTICTTSVGRKFSDSEPSPPPSRRTIFVENCYIFFAPLVENIVKEIDQAAFTETGTVSLVDFVVAIVYFLLLILSKICPNFFSLLVE